jgi:putative hydrolase of HD superfamily
VSSDREEIQQPAMLLDDAAMAIITVMQRIERLKHLPRAGWIDREVQQPETVAAHSWRLAVLALLAAQISGLDAGKAVRVALVHDLAEAITGDQTPFDELGATAGDRRALAANPPERVTWRNPERRQQKIRLERAALQRILAGLPDSVVRVLRDAWEEYEAGISEEAQLVQQLDKLEALIQGYDYLRSGQLFDSRTLRSFQIDAREVARVPAAVALLQALDGMMGATPRPGADTTYAEAGADT